MITSEYAGFLGSDYLAGYVTNGGAAVKFVVPADDDDAHAFSSELLLVAATNRFLSVRVDAVTTRVHLMDQVFFDIARQIDWRALARRAVSDTVTAAGYPPSGLAPPGNPDGLPDPLAIDQLASRHHVDVAELSRDLNRELQQRIMRDYQMTLEFRVAMLRLCQAELATGQVTETERDAVISWLSGELRQMSILRSAMIFRRVGRHNARPLLFSLAHWLHTCGWAGLVVEVDIRRLGFARRPLPDERHGLYYTKAALLDAYELLRQLVDNTDDLAHCTVVVTCAPEFLTDETRGVGAYQALKLRVHHEVRDRTRENPFASLARLENP